MPNANTNPHLTEHAQVRLTQRRISPEALAAVLTYGRRVHVRATQIRAIGRQEVARFRVKGVDLRPYEGLQVLVDNSSETVITAYRNHDFRGLKGAW